MKKFLFGEDFTIQQKKNVTLRTLVTYPPLSIKADLNSGIINKTQENLGKDIPDRKIDLI